MSIAHFIANRNESQSVVAFSPTNGNRNRNRNSNNSISRIVIVLFQMAVLKFHGFIA